MALFTGTPIIVDIPAPGDSGMGLADLGQFKGRWIYNGNYYLLGYGENVHGAIVAKSTDQGATWTIFQETAPIAARAEVQGILDPTNGVIHVVGNQPVPTGAGKLTYKAFDLSTDTFGSLVNTAGSATINGVAVRPDGSVRIIFHSAGSLQYMPVVAGAFGTSGVIDAAGNIGSCVCDSSGVIHIGYKSGAALKYVTLSATDSPGTPSTVTASFPDTNIGNICLAFSRIIIVSTGFFSADIAHFWEGTPGSWTGPTNLHGAVSGVQDIDVCTINADSEVWFFYDYSDFNTPPTTVGVNRVQYDGTTLGAPEVYWDAVANPPPGMPATAEQEFDGISAVQDAGGIAVAVTSNIDSSGNISTIYLPIDVAVIRIRNRFY